MLASHDEKGPQCLQATRNLRRRRGASHCDNQVGANLARCVGMPFVRDRMTSPVISQAPDVAVPDLLRVLETYAISAVPILRDGHLVGIVSTTDLVREEADGPGGKRRAADLMHAPVYVVGPDDPVEEAARRMVRQRVHRLVVVDKERAVGVVSARDVLGEVKHARIALPIRELMTPEVVTVDIGDPIDEAIAKLAHAQVHGVVVLDGTRPVGVFTHAEALSAGKLPPEIRSRDPVEEVMSYETICLDAAVPTYRAAGHAMAMNVRRILVVERHHLVGVLSCLDLLRPIVH
jgi:CBS domain-containing protein